MKANEKDLYELSTEDLISINGGGPAFEWLGRVVRDINRIMQEACNNGYEHAGLFY